MAVNSDGNTWDTSRTSFTLFDSALSDLLGESILVEKVVPFQVADTTESPQDYVYTIPFVSRGDAGIYTARVAEQDCKYILAII